MSSSYEQSSKIQHLITQLEDTNPDNRLAAAEEFQKLGRADSLSEDQAEIAFEALQERARKETHFATCYHIVEAIAVIRKPPSNLVDSLIENLSVARSEAIRRAAIEELEKLGSVASKALPDLKHCVLENEWWRYEALQAIKVIASEEDVKNFVKTEMQPPEKYGNFLVDHGLDVLADIWSDNPELALQYVVAGLKDSKKPEAAAWLRERAPAIPGNSKIPEVLKWQLVDQLKSWKLREHSPQVRQLLKETLSLLEGLTAIQTWITWIEEESKTSLTQAQMQAEQMRSDPNSVRYLVSEFEEKNKESNGLGRILVEESPKTELELLERRDRTPESLSKSENDRLDRWLNDLSTQSYEFAKVKSIGDTEIMIDCLNNERDIYEKNLRVRQRIVGLLAEMSNYPRFSKDKPYEEVPYEDVMNGKERGYASPQQKRNTKPQQWDLDTYNSKIKEELQKHVTPVFGRRLPKENDEDIRANMTRTLANIGGRESVEALVQAIIGEERKHDRRQRLLDEYYLQPSRDRGEEAAKMLQDALGHAKNTMVILQGLNIALFLVGLGMIIYSFILLSKGPLNQSKQLEVAISAGGGFAAIMTSFIKNPLDRIQNAMSRLVQLEAAFTSFVWDLNLNSTYIQSQYVAKGILSDDDIALTVGRIQDAMNLTLNMVQTYGIQHEQRIETRIHSLSSEQLDGNTVISLYGQFPQGDSKKILVNHKPLEAQADQWTDTKVQFKLPAHIASESGEIWVSLFFDGIETNAVPCKVGRSNIDSPTDASVSQSGSAATSAV